MITFKQVNDKRVDIIVNDKKVGHIVTPAGSGEDIENAIQVCGFDEAYDLWGCGLFGEQHTEIHVETKGKLVGGQVMTQGGINHIVKMKKDIQLLFDNPKQISKIRDLSLTEDCHKCYSSPCQCEVRVARTLRPFITKISKELRCIKCEHNLTSNPKGICTPCAVAKEI